MIYLYTNKINELFFFTWSRGKESQISNRALSDVYYSLITGLGLTVIGKSHPSIRIEIARSERK